YHSELDPETVVYHDIVSYRLEARRDEEALRQSLGGLFERHEVLRTWFDLTNYSEPLQMVASEVELPLDVKDVRGLGEEEQGREIRDWLGREMRGRVDWGEGPLGRRGGHWLGEESFQVSLGFHHAIPDGWRVASVKMELVQEYWQRLGLRGGAIAEAPETRYRDYIALERASLKSDECRQYWGEKLREQEPGRLPRVKKERGEGQARRV